MRPSVKVLTYHRCHLPRFFWWKPDGAGVQG